MTPLPSSRKAGFTLKSMLLVTAVLAVAAGLAFPRYEQRLEKEQALRMQDLLRQTCAAEQNYYAQYGQYTDRWDRLAAFWNMDETAPFSERRENRPAEYFVAFSAFAQARRDGFIVTLQTQSDGLAGVVSAARTGSGREQYDLVRPFPRGETECIPLQNRSESFCRKL